MAKATPAHFDRLRYRWTIVEQIGECELCVGAKVGDYCVELNNQRDGRLEKYENYIGWVPYFFKRTNLKFGLYLKVWKNLLLIFTITNSIFN